MAVRTTEGLTPTGATVPSRSIASSRSKARQEERCCTGAREDELELASDSSKSKAAHFFLRCFLLGPVDLEHVDLAVFPDRGFEHRALDFGPADLAGFPDRESALLALDQRSMIAVPILAGYAAESFKACFKPVTVLLPWMRHSLTRSLCLRPGHRHLQARSRTHA